MRCLKALLHRTVKFITSWTVVDINKDIQFGRDAWTVWVAIGSWQVSSDQFTSCLYLLTTARRFSWNCTAGATRRKRCCKASSRTGYAWKKMHFHPYEVQTSTSPTYFNLSSNRLWLLRIDGNHGVLIFAIFSTDSLLFHVYQHRNELAYAWSK